MPELVTRVKQFKRIDIGSMNNRIAIYDRNIQPPDASSSFIDFTEQFAPKLNCWACIETVKGVTIFDHTNTERDVTHGISMRNVPFTQSIGAVNYFAMSAIYLNDLSIAGTYSGVAQTDYWIAIDGVGTPDTFKWSVDHGQTWTAQNVVITGAAQLLNNGMSITFGNTTGHILGDTWKVRVSAGVRISSQDWIYYQNQFMGQISLYDILKVNSLNEENRYLYLLCALTGDYGYGANVA